jgi:hypothetical protein
MPSPVCASGKDTTPAVLLLLLLLALTALVCSRDLGAQPGRHARTGGRQSVPAGDVLLVLVVVLLVHSWRACTSRADALGAPTLVPTACCAGVWRRTAAIAASKRAPCCCCCAASGPSWCSRRRSSMVMAGSCSACRDELARRGG